MNEKEMWKALSDNLVLLGEWIQRNAFPDPDAILAEVSFPAGASEGFLRKAKYIITSTAIPTAEELGRDMETKLSVYLQFVLLEYPYIKNCILRGELPDFGRLKIYPLLIQYIKETTTSSFPTGVPTRIL